MYGKKTWEKKMWLSASYTVEAAFVVPMILGILFALLYFLYYEHDKIILQGNVQKAAVYLAGNEEKAPVKTEWIRQLQENLWLAQAEGGSISKNRLHINAYGQAKMHLKIPVMEYFLTEKQSCTYRIKIQIWQPEQSIRWKGVLPETGEDASE